MKSQISKRIWNWKNNGLNVMHVNGLLLRIQALQKSTVSLVTLSNGTLLHGWKKILPRQELDRKKNVSVSSVYRVLKRFYQPLNPFKTTLPTVLHFNEFKSVRQVSGAMSFIILNDQTRKLFDIVENRQLPYLERYFNRFPLPIRENV